MLFATRARNTLRLIASDYHGSVRAFASPPPLVSSPEVVKEIADLVARSRSAWQLFDAI